MEEGFIMTNETLLHNVTSGIFDATKSAIGESYLLPDGFAQIVIGIFILLLFILVIYKANLGVWGLIVIIPALTYVLAEESVGVRLLPPFVAPFVILITGVIWGLIILRLFREG